MIEKFKYFSERKAFSWIENGMRFNFQSENPLVAVVLKSGSGFLVVEPASSKAPHNAMILDSQGYEVARIMNPEAANGAICFSDAYYIHEELTLFIAFSSWQMGCVIDENGVVLRTYESR